MWSKRVKLPTRRVLVGRMRLQFFLAITFYALACALRLRALTLLLSQVSEVSLVVGQVQLELHDCLV